MLTAEQKLAKIFEVAHKPRNGDPIQVYFEDLGFTLETEEIVDLIEGAGGQVRSVFGYYFEYDMPERELYRVEFYDGERQSFNVVAESRFHAVEYCAEVYGFHDVEVDDDGLSFTHRESEEQVDVCVEISEIAPDPGYIGYIGRRIECMHDDIFKSAEYVRNLPLKAYNILADELDMNDALSFVLEKKKDTEFGQKCKAAYDAMIELSNHIYNIWNDEMEAMAEQRASEASGAWHR